MNKDKRREFELKLLLLMMEYDAIITVNTLDAYMDYEGIQGFEITVGEEVDDG